MQRGGPYNLCHATQEPPPAPRPPPPRGSASAAPDPRRPASATSSSPRTTRRTASAARSASYRDACPDPTSRFLVAHGRLPATAPPTVVAGATRARTTASSVRVPEARQGRRDRRDVPPRRRRAASASSTPTARRRRRSCCAWPRRARQADGAIATRRHPAAVLPGAPPARAAARPAPASRWRTAPARAALPRHAVRREGAAPRGRRGRAAAPAARDLLFDVDLLLTATEAGHRIVEVPTIWIDQAGSRVSAVGRQPRMGASLRAPVARRRRAGEGRRSPGGRALRPDVALIAPYPPRGERHGGFSGVASYTANLAGALADARRGGHRDRAGRGRRAGARAPRRVTVERRFGAAAPAALPARPRGRARDGRPRRPPAARDLPLRRPAAVPGLARRAAPAAPRAAAGRRDDAPRRRPAAGRPGFTRLHRVRAPATVARAGLGRRPGGDPPRRADAVVVHEPAFAQASPARPSCRTASSWPSRFRHAPPRARAPRACDDRLTVLCFGFLAPYKGLEAALERRAPRPATRCDSWSPAARIRGMAGRATPSACAERCAPTRRFTGYVPDGRGRELVRRRRRRAVPLPAAVREQRRHSRSRSPPARPALLSPALAACVGAPGRPWRCRATPRRLGAAPGGAGRRPRRARAGSARRPAISARERAWPTVAGRHLDLYEEVKRCRPPFWPGAFGQRNPGDEALLRAFVQALPSGWDAVATSSTPAETQTAHGVPTVHARDGLARRARGGAAPTPSCSPAAPSSSARTRERPPAARAARARPSPSPCWPATAGRPLALVGVGAAPLRARSARLLARATRLARRSARAARRGVRRPAGGRRAARGAVPRGRRTPPGRSCDDAARRARRWRTGRGRDQPRGRRPGARRLPVRGAGGRRRLRPADRAAAVAGHRHGHRRPAHRPGGRRPPARRRHGARPARQPARGARRCTRRARLVLGLRFHALVAAAAAGAPFLALAHEPKLDRPRPAARAAERAAADAARACSGGDCWPRRPSRAPPPRRCAPRWPPPRRASGCFVSCCRPAARPRRPTASYFDPWRRSDDCTRPAGARGRPARARARVRAPWPASSALVAGAQVAGRLGNLVFSLVARAPAGAGAFAPLAAFLGLYLVVHVPALSLSGGSRSAPGLGPGPPAATGGIGAGRRRRRGGRARRSWRPRCGLPVALRARCSPPRCRRLRRSRSTRGRLYGEGRHAPRGGEPAGRAGAARRRSGCRWRSASARPAPPARSCSPAGPRSASPSRPPDGAGAKPATSAAAPSVPWATHRAPSWRWPSSRTRTCCGANALLAAAEAARFARALDARRHRGLREHHGAARAAAARGPRRAARARPPPSASRPRSAWAACLVVAAAPGGRRRRVRRALRRSRPLFARYLLAMALLGVARVLVAHLRDRPTAGRRHCRPRRRWCSSGCSRVRRQRPGDRRLHARGVRRTRRGGGRRRRRRARPSRRPRHGHRPPGRLARAGGQDRHAAPHAGTPRGPDRRRPDAAGAGAAAADRARPVARRGDRGRSRRRCRSAACSTSCARPTCTRRCTTPAVGDRAASSATASWPSGCRR